MDFNEKELERAITRIIRKLKGWDAKDHAYDERDHPVSHRAERLWLKKELIELGKEGRRAGTRQ